MAKKKKLDQIVFEHIINQIERGELLQRQHITEQGIADELDVSRTPVRKAFERLVQEDYLENIENVGVHVKIRPLNSKGFQERADFIERLINHYLFDIEKAEVIFEAENLKGITDGLNELAQSDKRFFEDEVLHYFDRLLVYNDNSYSTQTILKTVKEIVTDKGYIYQIVKNSRSLIMNHLYELTDHLIANNFAKARREIRILLNQLKLNVIENDQII